jgi:hypothetical protein
VEHVESAGRRFEKIEDRLSAVEGKVAQREALIERLDADFYNHGRDGMKTVLSNFITRIDTEKQMEKDQRNHEHRINTRKLNLLMAVATTGLLLIAVLTLFLTYETSKHSQLDPAKIFHAESFDSFFSFDHQSATIPTLRR